MNTSKLKEALSELKAERSSIDAAIRSLEQIIEGTKQAHAEIVRQTFDAAIGQVRTSYVELVVSILQKHGRPMRLVDLTPEVSKLKGSGVERRSLEATLVRHIIQAKDRAKIVRVGPGIYGLPAWPTAIASIP